MTADIPARTDADIEPIERHTLPHQETGEAHYAGDGCVTTDDPVAALQAMQRQAIERHDCERCVAMGYAAESLLARAQKAEAQYADLYSRIGDLQASEADLVSGPIRAERDRLRAELTEAKRDKDYLYGRTLDLGDERDRLSAQVAAVRALCDNGVFDVRQWGERGTPFSNGGSQAFKRVRAALASAASPITMQSEPITTSPEPSEGEQ